MKKVLFTMAFVAAAFFCQAQLFVGGGLGVGFGGGSTEDMGVDGKMVTTDAPKTLGFGIHPTVGYMFNEKMGVGLSAGFGFERSKSEETILNSTTTTTEKTPKWEIAPFFRYVIADWEPVTLYADLVVGIGGGKSTKKVEDNTGSVTSNGPKTFNFGINVVPGIAYNLTDNISINAEVDLLALGYNMTKETTTLKDLTNKEYDRVVKTNDFGFGFNRPTALTVGFFYTF